MIYKPKLINLLINQSPEAFFGWLPSFLSAPCLDFKDHLAHRLVMKIKGNVKGFPAMLTCTLGIRSRTLVVLARCPYQSGTYLLDLQKQSFCLLFHIIHDALHTVPPATTSLFIHLSQYLHFHRLPSSLHYPLINTLDFDFLRKCLVENAPLELYQRRREFRESASLNREMSLTEYIVRTDPLWPTTLIDRPHRPVETICPELKEEMLRIMPEIRSTLRSHGISRHT